MKDPVLLGSLVITVILAFFLAANIIFRNNNK